MIKVNVCDIRISVGEGLRSGLLGWRGVGRILERGGFELDLVRKRERYFYGEISICRGVEV